MNTIASNNFFGKKDDFVMFLPDDMPLISYHVEFEVIHQEQALELLVSTTLDQVSMNNLIKEQIFPKIELPEIKPLTKYELRLDLVAKKSLCETLDALVKTEPGKNPIQLVIEREDKSVPPFRYISNYLVKSWAFIETPLASSEFIELASKPPGN